MLSYIWIEHNGTLFERKVVSFGRSISLFYFYEMSPTIRFIVLPTHPFGKIVLFPHFIHSFRTCLQ